MTPASTARRIFAIALLLYVSTAGGSLTTSDAVIAFDVAKNICERGTLEYSPELLGTEATRGPDGRFYAPFGIAQSIYDIPFYLAGRTVQRALNLHIGKPDSVPKAAVALGGTVASAACVALTFLLAFEMSGAMSAGLGAAALLGVATVFWPYAKFGFNAPLAACFLVAGALWLWRAARGRGIAAAAICGFCFGGALLARHELLLAAVPAAAFAGVERRHRRLDTARIAAGTTTLAISVAVWALVNWIRFGGPFETGYTGDPTPALGSSVIAGLYGLLLSPASSLFAYCPVMLLALPALVWWWRRNRSATILAGGMFLTLLLFYAQLGNWVGGRSYGPRYLVPGLPFLAVAIAVWLHDVGSRSVRVLALSLCVLSALVQLPGVLVDYSKVSVQWARQYQGGTLPDRRFVWSASPLVLNAVAAARATPPNARYLLHLEQPPAVERTGAEGARDFSQQFQFSLDFWWLYLFYLGAWGAAAAVAVGVTPLVIALVLAWRLRSLWCQPVSHPSVST